MKKHLFFWMVFLCALSSRVYAQGCPVNIDFEGGDFTNWDCFTGTTKADSGNNSFLLTPSQPVKGRHEIISATTPSALDKYGKFPQLCPYGGKYSVKLGNDLTGSEAEGLSYTFQVPANVDTFSFTYFYAVVFQDPDHSMIQQPRFFVTAYDVETGKIINCASYDYVANGAIPGFEVSSVGSDVLFKNWSPASIEFAGLANHTVRLEFKTADCTLGGHFGYAYVDVGSGCSNLLATAPYCIQSDAVILNAPYGFQSYTWFNSDYSTVIGSQRSLTLSPPPATDGMFHVSMIPYPGYGCMDTAHAIVTPIGIPDTPTGPDTLDFCQYENLPQVTATPSPGCDLIWYTSKDGGIGSEKPPVPKTNVPAVFEYYVSQKVLFGCESFRRRIVVRINPMPTTMFTTNISRQCQTDNLFSFKSTSSNLRNTTYTWDFGDGVVQSSATDSIISHVYANSGNFVVKLKVLNDPKCAVERIQNVTVVPKPSSTFTYPVNICEKQTQLNIVNTSAVAGGVSTINKWWWNVNGTIYTTQNTPSFVPVSPVNIPVQLVVTTAEGCRSDTNKTMLPVRHRPVAGFKFTKPLCDNEMISFSDFSAMPTGGGAERINKWHWQFAGSATVTTQHPSVRLSAGLQHAKLVAESEYGCRSIEADSSFIINPKPAIQLSVNDSCVFRVIRYSAVDLAGTVDKWYWNFGGGLKEDVPVITKMFNREGTHPFTLLAQTVHGCKDTIIRPFTIFDNKAYAGKDTTAAMGEPVQLFGHGGANVRYTWTPTLGLNDGSKENPVATLDKEQEYKLDAVTDKGCDSHTSIRIKRYKGPDIYIPTAFTPNSDGLNDHLKVFPIGTKSFEFFAVYNRYGERIYYTTDQLQGWDGTYKGEKLGTGNFVVVAKATDYKGNPMLKKENVVLIR
ncbi:T9SS type B sorting domain-containing protein [Segetibacter sp. 3557_3]|uniref:PKD domain-containing protein n=1 Tax=Segetibacter sp. 3557_3 TaxID=2547429 RepID=UPI001058B4C9|nr:PKD domain-containing protein [Segetibacter sp. 3557_3]TDH27289.1 T9SS type B sorting domain-containing protein [Segetibacter sp. 3557_3]